MIKIKTICIAAIAAATLGACNLDYSPHSSIEDRNAIQSSVDIQRMSNALYSGLRGRSNGVFNIYADLCTEDFVATDEYGNNYGGAAYWDTRTSNEEEIRAIWKGYYFLIANANRLINDYRRIDYPTQEDKRILNEALGTAYTTRALCYTYLVSRFALPYYSDKNGGTLNADSLAVPLELTVDLNKRLPRATLAQVYAQINADLDSAAVHMSALRAAGVAPAMYKKSPSRFNLDAVNVLRARVKLYQGAWSDALTAAEAVINTGKYPLSTTQEGLTKLWATDEGTEIITHLFISDTETPNTHGAYLSWNKFVSGFPTYRAYFLPTQKAMDQYEDADYRFECYYSKDYLSFGGKYLPLYAFAKYPRTTEFVPTGGTTHSPIIFRSAEAYLTAAEAATRLGDDAKAQQYLNALRVSRGLTATTTTGSALLAEVQQERHKEFMGEGFNLTDKKRWHQGVDRAVMGMQTYKGSSPAIESALKQTYEAGHPRFVWPIPNSETANNLLMVQNPSY